MEAEFRQIKGVVNVISGYAGGHFPNPSYEDVCSGRTGHAEVVEVEFDPGLVSYDQLLKHFWGTHDYTAPNRSYGNQKSQYRAIAIYTTPEQGEAARQSRENLENSRRSTRPVTTEVEPLTVFWPAEEYHQRYYEKHRLYGFACRVLGK